MLNLREIMQEKRRGQSSSPDTCEERSRSHFAAKTAAQKQQHSPARLSIRDKLLVYEVDELRLALENVESCSLHFPSSSQLSRFHLLVSPREGIYAGGKFRFRVDVPPEYNNVPPDVKCLTRIWHPNITEEGNVCLSLLRTVSLDGCGWTPTRHLKDVVLGLNSLFTDLLDFDDPLNAQAADLWYKDKPSFERKVSEYIKAYCEKP